MATATVFFEIPASGIDPANADLPFEIIDGQPLERTGMSAEADRVSVVLIGMIQAHSNGKLGLCFSGHCGYQSIFPNDPKRLRFPDVSFVKPGRLPRDKPPRGNMEIVPDLIVEVVSPNDKAEDIEQRLTDFLLAGVPLAWIVYPQTKQIYVFHQGPASLRLREGDVLDGEDVLPGFGLALGDLFADL